MPLDFDSCIEVKKFASSLSDHLLPSSEARKYKQLLATPPRRSSAQLAHPPYDKAATVRLVQRSVQPQSFEAPDYDGEDKGNEALYETDGNILIMSSAPSPPPIILDVAFPDLVLPAADVTALGKENLIPAAAAALVPGPPEHRLKHHGRGKKGGAHANQAEPNPPETNSNGDGGAGGDVLDKVTYLLTLHPKYFDTFYRAHIFMLKGNGPLKLSDRCYVAMIAASRFHCKCLVEYQKREYLAQGGDASYLERLDNVPPKLRDLQDINKVLAHQPWLINKSHIEKLTKGSHNWSLSELIFAVAIMTHFHALSSLVYGCAWLYGFKEEVPPPPPPKPLPNLAKNFHANSVNPSSAPESQAETGVTEPEPEGTVDALVVKMKRLHQQLRHELDTSHEEMLQRYEKVVEQDNHSSNSQGSLKEEGEGSVKPSTSPLIEDPAFGYEDFAKRDLPNRASTFRIQDYTWEHHGFSLVSRLCSDLGPLLDDKFRAAYNLTYLTMGKVQGIDTSTFRRAIWNYIHCMFGIRHDDYDYSEVNHLLGREFKTYIKTLTCYPERVYSLDNQNFMKDFKESEKVHVNLMIMEAKIQAQMLYALRAIMQYMT